MHKLLNQLSILKGAHNLLQHMIHVVLEVLISNGVRFAFLQDRGIEVL